MHNVAVVCEDAKSSYIDAKFALNANNYFFQDDNLNRCITFPGFNTAYTFVDGSTPISVGWDSIVRKGWPSNMTEQYWSSIIKCTPTTYNSMLARSEVQFLGGISLFNTSSYDDDWMYGSGSYWNPRPEVKEKCECGVSIAMGKDDHPEHHSDWCPIRKKYDREKK